MVEQIKIEIKLEASMEQADKMLRTMLEALEVEDLDMISNTTVSQMTEVIIDAETYRLNQEERKNGL